MSRVSAVTGAWCPECCPCGSSLVLMSCHRPCHHWPPHPSTASSWPTALAKATSTANHCSILQLTPPIHQLSNNNKAINLIRHQMFSNYSSLDKNIAIASLSNSLSFHVMPQCMDEVIHIMYYIWPDSTYYHIFWNLIILKCFDGGIPQFNNISYLVMPPQWEYLREAKCIFAYLLITPPPCWMREQVGISWRHNHSFWGGQLLM